MILCFFITSCAIPKKHKNLEETIEYPSRAWDASIGGKVKAMYDVNNDGRAEKIRIIESHPRMMFDKQVKDALRKWHFKKNSPKKDKVINVKFKRKS